VPLDDGRTLWVLRLAPGARLRAAAGQGGAARSDVLRPLPPPLLPFMPPAWQGLGPVVLLVLLFVAVAAGAWPAVRHLTRRLQALKKGVEQFGAGQLHHRVEVSGRDEVAAVASSFNLAAERIENLVRSHQSLLANASHELRSPLARMKMAVQMLDGATPEQALRLKREIETNVGELDALVEEVLLASRLDAVQRVDKRDPVDLLALAAEEGSRVDAAVDGASATVAGDERLLRRALRNLLENARRYGGDDITVKVDSSGNQATVQVCDRGPGVPESQRERIFEAFYRMPGHAEQAGGVGLGLSLVKQIAERHGGSVRCTGREGGGSCFELVFPRA
jgi:signal transduction histidine kinase